MDSISGRYQISNNTPVTSNIPAAKEETDKTPTDTVDLKGSQTEEKPKAAGNWFTMFLDVRRPTMTKEFNDEQRKEVMGLIQPGDIILETNDAYPGWQVFEKITLKSGFTHAAIYEGDGKFIEATTGDPSGKGVVRTDLEDYLHGRIQFEVIRPPYKTPEDREASLNFARSQLGKPYDGDFVLEDDKKIYCAELVERALKAMPNPIETPLVKFAGKTAVAPDSFEKIPGAEVKWSNKSTFLKSLASHAPIWAGMAVGGVLGGMTMGPWGAVGGTLVGRMLSTFIGNYMQEGFFGYFPHEAK